MTYLWIPVIPWHGYMVCCSVAKSTTVPVPMTTCDPYPRVFPHPWPTLYTVLWSAYYWSNMRWNLENSYIPSCTDCQQNKYCATRAARTLHPLLVPDERGDSVTINFIGPMPPDDNYDCLTSMTDAWILTYRLFLHVWTSPLRISPSLLVLWKQAAPQHHLRPGQAFHFTLLESPYTAHRLSSQDVLSLSSWNRQSKQVLQQNHQSVPLLSCTTKSERMGASVASYLPLYHKHQEHVNKFSPFELCMGWSPRVIPPLVVNPLTLQDQHVALSQSQCQQGQGQFASG